MTRRRLLGVAAGTVAAGTLYLMPPNLHRALAQTSARPGALRDIKHLVLLMKENHSFDHYSGTLACARDFDDARVPTQPNGRSIFYQPDDTNPR